MLKASQCKNPEALPNWKLRLWELQGFSNVVTIPCWHPIYFYTIYWCAIGSLAHALIHGA
eukprot:3170248-Ditylum_brightwellii.AAC.1